MQIPVLVESTADGQFRAAAPPPFGLAEIGKTSEEAVSRLQTKMAALVSNGKHLVAVEVPARQEHPWMPFVGQFENDPLFDKWQEAIAEYRREIAAKDAQCPGTSLIRTFSRCFSTITRRCGRVFWHIPAMIFVWPW